MNRVYLASVNPDTKTVLWARPDCHLWSCPDCAEINKRRWAAMIVYGINQYTEINSSTGWFFDTLTTHRAISTVNASLYVFRQAWPKLQRRMKRIAGGNFHYVLLPELGARTLRFHQHMIADFDFGERWLKDNAAECGLGYMAKHVPVDNAGIASWYVTKYVTKSLEMGLKWPKSLHRVRTSQHWPKQENEALWANLGLSPQSPEKWEELSHTLAGYGYTFTNISTGEISHIC